MLGYGRPREKSVWLVDDRDLERYAALDHRIVWTWAFGVPMAFSLLGPSLGLSLGFASKAYFDALLWAPALASPLIAVTYVRAWKRFFVGSAYCLVMVAIDFIARPLISAGSLSAWGELLDLRSTVWLFLTFLMGETILLCQDRLAFLRNEAPGDCD